MPRARRRTRYYRKSTATKQRVLLKHETAVGTGCLMGVSSNVRLPSSIGIRLEIKRQRNLPQPDGPISETNELAEWPMEANIVESGRYARRWD